MHNLLEMSDESRADFKALKEREAPRLAQKFTPRDADLFWVRLERYFEDARFPLLQLYGDRPDSLPPFSTVWSMPTCHGPSPCDCSTWSGRSRPTGSNVRTWWATSAIRSFSPGSFTFYPEMAGGGRWVWTTFYDYQWDLNYANPVVFREMLETMFFLVDQGVDVLRLDAAPFLWKRMGSNCQNQPEVFLLIQAFRALLRVVAPGVILKAEAIVAPDALQQYIGVKTTVGKQCELAYNNQLMVNLWSGLATRKASLATQAAQRAPRLLLGAAPINYVRNHDDIGWAMADDDLAAIGEDPFLHRQFLNDFYTGRFPGSFARGSFFQFHPETGDARISGTTATCWCWPTSTSIRSPCRTIYTITSASLAVYATCSLNMCRLIPPVADSTLSLTKRSGWWGKTEIKMRSTMLAVD